MFFLPVFGGGFGAYIPFGGKSKRGVGSKFDFILIDITVGGGRELTVKIDPLLC